MYENGRSPRCVPVSAAAEAAAVGFFQIFVVTIS
jgi:hypothetical protein